MVSLSSTDGGRGCRQDTNPRPRPNPNPSPSPVRMQSSWKLILSQLRIGGKCHYGYRDIYTHFRSAHRVDAVDDEPVVLVSVCISCVCEGRFWCCQLVEAALFYGSLFFPIPQIEILSCGRRRVAWFPYFITRFFKRFDLLAICLALGNFGVGLLGE